MTLTALSEGAFLFAGAVNSVVFTQGESALIPAPALIADTGLDESHARKLLRAIQEAGLTPAAI